MFNQVSMINCEETQGFLSPDDQAELFGSGAEVMKIPTQAQLKSMSDLGHFEDFGQLSGEFKIEKAFSGQQRASHFSVTNPQIIKEGDYTQYTCCGLYKNEKFEVFRRYSDFDALRECLAERFPGMYVPPIPGKKYVSNKAEAFVEERCFLLNMFLK